MIKHLHIENIKSLKKISLPLTKLNLYFGMNGMGKSSVIQSLLLCRQSYWMNDKKNLDTLYLNGDLVELGTADEIFCDNADNNIMQINIKCSDVQQYCFKYSYNTEDVFSNKLHAEFKHDAGTIYDIPLFGEDFAYISAEHIGPQRRYHYNRIMTDQMNKYGNKGELIVPFLAMEGDMFHVPKELCIEDARTDTLIDQIGAWMQQISPGIRFDTELIPSKQEATLGISYKKESRMVSKIYSPVNVGFGIPYILPIIVSLLTATPGGIVIIENPESHLHPRGQAVISELIARVAGLGVQVICESHSDHIINGIRVAIKEGKIACEDVSVIYFDQDENLNTKLTNIQIDKNGNLDEYPVGLLDEWGELMSRLL